MTTKNDITMTLKDPGHILSNFDADTIEYLKTIGLKLTQADGVYSIEALVNVANLEALKISEKTIDSTLRNIETTFLHANIAEARSIAKTNSETQAAEEKQKRADLKSKLSSDYQHLEFSYTDHGDILIDFRKDDSVFEEGSTDVPKSREVAFDEAMAREKAERMTNERAAKLKAENEVMLAVNYDIVSQHQVSKLVGAISESQNPYEFVFAGVTVHNKPRNFALNKDDFQLYGKELKTGVIREVVISETDRHYDVLVSHFSAFGIFFKKALEGHGCHVAYWSQGATTPEKEQYWRKNTPVIGSYKEAANYAQWLVNDRFDPSKNEGKPSGLPPKSNAVRGGGANRQMSRKLPPKTVQKISLRKETEEPKAHGFVVDTGVPAERAVVSYGS